MDKSGWNVSSDEARRNLRSLLNSVEREQAHVVISRYGDRAAVLVPVEWYEAAKAALGAVEG